MEINKAKPGSFCWFELATSDQAAAKKFYGGLFGWTANDLPMGENMVYSMMTIDGKDVAAISPQPQQQREAGVPPAWNSYITVDSADRAELGADRAGRSMVRKNSQHSLRMCSPREMPAESVN